MAWQDIDFAMRLYHFINEQYGLDDLGKKRLKIARIMELNDPFEFLGVDLSNHTFRKAIEATKKEIDRGCGLLCFSKSWDNPLPWAHYADGHKGLCLGFDISAPLMEVNYVDERLSVDDFMAESRDLGSWLKGKKKDHIGQPRSSDEYEQRRGEFLRDVYPELLWRNVQSDENGLAFVKKIISTKFSQWSYEKEYREFVLLDNKENDGLYYEDFSDDHLNLKEVIIGLRSCVTRARIEDDLGAMAGRVTIFKARADDRKFAVVKDEQNAF